MFFDSLGTEYRYEPHSYDVETGGRCFHYKPDFFLPGLSKYIEIKPTQPVHLENSRCAAWTRDIGDIYLLFHLGPPSESKENGWLYYHDETMNGPPLLCKCQYWCECPICGMIDIEGDGEMRACGCLGSDYFCDEADENCASVLTDLTQSGRLLKAYRLARNRKFDEFGKQKASRIEFQRSLF